MAYKNFEQLIEHVRDLPRTRRIVIAAAEDEAVIASAIEARGRGIADPLFVGNRGRILEILTGLGESVPDGSVFDEPDAASACAKAVDLARSGEADFLMKGMVDTSVILKAVVDGKRGLRTGGLMSHIAIFDVPAYHKLMIVVDGGMVTYPTLDQKKRIIQNTVAALLSMGYNRPKVGVLACVESVNPKMPETVEADELKKMNVRGEIVNCVVEGPISYDCAVSEKIARKKGFVSEVAGDVDVLVAPNIHAGNIMGKMLVCICGARMAGFVAGGGRPVVLTSRASSGEEKFLSIAVSAAASRREDG
jgi:phosphate butyryltransferase